MTLISISDFSNRKGTKTSKMEMRHNNRSNSIKYE